MTASFDPRLTIVKHQHVSHRGFEHEELGCLVPQGPLGLAADEEVLRLDIWVFQEQEGASCVAVLLPPIKGREKDRWEANPDPAEDHFGNGFKPGKAKAMGLMVKKNAKGVEVVEQWDKEIDLVLPAEGTSE